MNRANPASMRKVLEMVNELKKAGILFMPIPVLNQDDACELLAKLEFRLEVLEGAGDENNRTHKDNV